MKALIKMTPGALLPENANELTKAWQGNQRRMLINCFRWLGVLPGAVVAYLVVQLLNVIANWSMPEDERLPLILVQLWNSWIGTFALISVGASIAPNYKFVTAIILAALYLGLIGATLAVGFVSLHNTAKPFLIPWSLMTCAAISLFAAVVSCRYVKTHEGES